MTTMMTSTWDSPTPMVHTARAARSGRAGSASESDAASRVNVVNPFARRPLGQPLSRLERTGIAIIFAVLTAVVGTTLVRADRAWATTPASLAASASAALRS
jgi:hypothetical protein